MKKYVFFFILFSTIASSQIIDSTNIFKRKYNNSKSFLEFNDTLNNTLKKQVSKSVKIILLEKRLNIKFYNIETVLMTYSSSDILKLTNEDKKHIEELFTSVSNELYEQGHPTFISIDREEEPEVKKILQPSLNHKQIIVNLVSFKKNEFIKEKKVGILIDLFNKNVRDY